MACWERPGDEKRALSVRRSCSKDRDMGPTGSVGRKWSISSSMDYINKTGKGNYAVRSNPIGEVGSSSLIRT